MSLVDLYFRVYPEHDACELHWFMQGYGLGICINADAVRHYRLNERDAMQELYRKLWEKKVREERFY